MLKQSILTSSHQISSHAMDAIKFWTAETASISLIMRYGDVWQLGAPSTTKDFVYIAQYGRCQSFGLARIEMKFKYLGCGGRYAMLVAVPLYARTTCSIAYYPLLPRPTYCGKSSWKRCTFFCIGHRFMSIHSSCNRREDFQCEGVVRR